MSIPIRGFRPSCTAWECRNKNQIFLTYVPETLSAKPRKHARLGSRETPVETRLEAVGTLSAFLNGIALRAIWLIHRPFAIVAIPATSTRRVERSIKKSTINRCNPVRVHTPL